jgi:Xaa-Pro aminopeptidase
MYGKTYHGITKEKNFVDCVVDDLGKSGWLGRVVGMSLGGHRPSPSVAEKLIAGFQLAGSHVVDMTDPIREVRRIKSPKEIEYTLKAGEYMNTAVEELQRKVEPGMTELQVTAIYEAALRNAGSENMGIVNMCRSGVERLYSFHAPAGRRLIEKGKPFAIDFSGVHNRYHCNNSRVFCIGEPILPSGHEKEIVDCLRKSHDVKELMAGLLKPNMRVDELMEPVKEYYQKLGVWGKQFWTGGYEIGIAFPPDWCGTMVYGPKEFHFNADEFDEIRFVPGTVMNFEQGFVPIDTIVFSQTEARIMGTSTWDVIII